MQTEIAQSASISQRLASALLHLLQLNASVPEVGKSLTLPPPMTTTTTTPEVVLVGSI